MSAAHTTPAPARRRAEAPRRRCSLDRRRQRRSPRRSPSLAIAVWPASEADQARADGEQLRRTPSPQLHDAPSTPRRSTPR